MEPGNARQWSHKRVLCLACLLAGPGSAAAQQMQPHAGPLPMPASPGSLVTAPQFHVVVRPDLETGRSSALKPVV